MVRSQSHGLPVWTLSTAGLLVPVHFTWHLGASRGIWAFYVASGQFTSHQGSLRGTRAVTGRQGSLRGTRAVYMAPG
eukprot:4322704-Pleurochrysis_carterae.AAC.1